MKSLVWVLFFVSSGAYNGGTVSNYDREFSTKEECQFLVDQLYAAENGLRGIATAMCVQVTTK